MAKRASSPVIQYWPIVIFIFGLAGSWFTLKAEAGQQEKRLAKVEEKVEDQTQATSNILVNQAKQQATLDTMLEYVKEIRQKK